jgi:hypothetical protein
VSPAANTKKRGAAVWQASRTLTITSAFEASKKVKYPCCR